MTKHQTMFYLRYGKLINEINDKITVSAIKSDMIKFLKKFPGNLIYPSGIYQPINEKLGRFQFKITKPSKFLSIYFDGNNTFEIWTYTEWLYNYSDFYITWASIDKIKCYVELYPNDFKNIIE